MNFILIVFALPAYFLLNGFLAYPVHEKLLKGKYMGDKPAPARFWVVSAATPAILAKEAFECARDVIVPDNSLF